MKMRQEKASASALLSGFHEHAGLTDMVNAYEISYQELNAIRLHNRFFAIALSFFAKSSVKDDF